MPIAEETVGCFKEWGVTSRMISISTKEFTEVKSTLTGLFSSSEESGKLICKCCVTCSNFAVMFLLLSTTLKSTRPTYSTRTSEIMMLVAHARIVCRWIIQAFRLSWDINTSTRDGYEPCLHHSTPQTRASVSDCLERATCYLFALVFSKAYDLVQHNIILG